MTRVALITGGTSGIGLDVAKSLSKLGIWKLHLVGSNRERGQKAAASLFNTTYHQADVRDYKQLACVFESVFKSSHRLDFVFANAGIPDTLDFYAEQPQSEIPSDPGLDVLNINLNGVIYTSYLAMHYFRRSPDLANEKKNLILTSSIGGIYPCMLTPVYSGSKHALIGFTRSIGKRLCSEGVRVNAICPGVVKTPLLSDQLLSFFPAEVLIPIEHVTSVALRVLSGSEMVDAQGVRLSGEDIHSQTIHITAKNYYFINKPEIHDQETQITWNAMMGNN